METSALCSACEGIFDTPHSFTNPQSRPINHVKTTFIAAVRDGCPLCNVICRSMFGWIYAKASDRSARDPGAIEIPDDLQLRCTFTAVFTNAEEHSGPAGYVSALSQELSEGNAESIDHMLRSYELRLRMNLWNQGGSDERVSMIVRPVVPGSLDALMQTKLANQNHTASDENFQLMSRWLSDCTSSHKCSAWSKANRQGSWMPARLIDVHALRLVVTAELEKDVEYLTLSHCWGTRRPAQTLTDNYEQLKLGIPLDMINSVTYQEAFIITRRLGFRYIWIDSLCILQDSLQDWQIEAAHMSEVYGHSLLNLIAAHAKDGREGCFADRNILTVRPGKIKNPFNPLSDDAFLVYPVRLEKIYEEQVRASPVYKRAWILQERLLSARTLYFGREQLVWACGELEACEAFPNGADYISSRPHSQSFVDKQAVQLLLSNAVAPMANRSQRLSESWARVIKMYTSAQLTIERDKLVALQGIAARAQEHIGGRYLAGLWDNNERNLLWSLLWFADPSDRNRRRNREYIGPTWSWVSLSGRIEMSTPDPSWRHRISQPVLSVNYEPVWPAKVKIISATAEAPYQPYGQVTGGFLTVRGILKKTEMRIITEDDIFAYEFFDAEIYSSRGIGNGVSSQALCSCHLDIPSASEGVLPVICLPFIAEKEKRQGRFSGHSRVHGLLLEAAGRARREYFRIGHFTSSPRRDEEWAAWLVGLEEQTITIL